MNKKAKLAAAIILTACLGFAALIPSSALYNDITFESYTNLSENSAIPCLFRNDSVFSSYKKYPPVISDGIEYVPLEIFYGLSGIKISYSDDGSNFYIQNKNKNKYISFSISGDYAVTGSGSVHETKVHTFYNVHYVPLRVVCQETGIGCDSYNDGLNKIYVIKVYTAPGLSARELIQIHAPGIYGTVPETPDNPENTAPPSLPPSGEHPPENSPDNQPGNDTPGTPGNGESEPEIFPPRALYLFFDASGFENAGQTLDTLYANGIKATFFVTAEDILEYPDTVRQIYTGGHTLGIGFSQSVQELCADGGLEKYCTEAENALYEVLKTKTRLIMLPPDTDGLYEGAKLSERAALLGVRPVYFNIDARTDVLGAGTAASNLTESIKRLESVSRTRNAYIKLTHTASGRSAAASLASLAGKHRYVKFALFSEGSEQ